MAPVRREPIAAALSPLRPSAKENSRFRIVRRYSLLWRAHVRSRAAQPRHAIRAWYCPFTLAFRSDPRRVSGRLPRAVAVRAPAECVACSLAALGGATIDTATSALVKESRWL